MFSNITPQQDVKCLSCELIFLKDGNGSDWSSFVPLVPAEGTSFGSRALITRENADNLMKTLNLNSAFLLDLIGRPDYWAPQKHLEADKNGRLVACGQKI